MAIYNIRFITPDGEFTIQCPDDVYILDALDDHYGCLTNNDPNSGILCPIYVSGSNSSQGSLASGNGGHSSFASSGPENRCDSGISKSEFELILDANQTAFEKLSAKYRDLAQKTEQSFNKNNKRSYNKAQEIFQKYQKGSINKIKQSDLASVKNALALNEMKALEKNAAELSKGLNKVSKSSTIYDFWNAGVESFRKNDWRPIFDQAVSYGAGVTLARALSLVAVTHPIAIVGMAAAQALLSYYLSSERVSQWREEAERSFLNNTNKNIGNPKNCATK